MPSNQKNPNWPLPEDYHELTKDGQRQARCALLVRYQNPRFSNGQRAYWFKVAWDFWRHWYLVPMGEQFYKGGFKESPAYHFDIVGDVALYLFNIQAHPRGGGKTVIGAKELPLMLCVTRSNYVTVICSSTQGLIPEKVSQIKIQISENPRIINDFGELRPRARSENRPWNDRCLHLRNDSMIESVSLGQRQRGKRPKLYILDDPEYDAQKDSEERRADLRQEMENHLQKVVIGMLPPDCGILWLGTMLGKRSYLYHACHSKDKAFMEWNRRVIAGAKLDPDTGQVIQTCWPSNWTPDFLEFKRKTMGHSFMAEYMNDPVSETERMIKIEPVRNEYYYDILPVNADHREEPHLPHPDAKIKYYYSTGYNPAGHMTWQVTEINALTYFKGLYKILTFDYAQSMRSWADYSCLIITGYDSRNTAWVLDSWMGKMQDEALMNMVMKFAGAWQCNYIGLESVTGQKKLVSKAEHVLMMRQSAGSSAYDWEPKIRPIQYKGNPKKGIRIAQLAGDFTRGSIKLPGSLKHLWPWNAGFRQLKDFTIDLKLLRRDDWIDTLAMTKYARHGRGTSDPSMGYNVKQDIADKVKEGKPIVEGFDGLQGLGLNNITDEILDAIAQKQYREQELERDFDGQCWPIPLVVE